MLKFRVSGTKIDLEILSQTLRQMNILSGDVSKFYIDRGQSGKGDFAIGRIYFELEVGYFQQAALKQKG